ncbi:MAG: DUF4407 domain-containing protein [Bacteroidota bacterium]
MNNISADYPLEKATKITKFLWWCAGADEYFLLKSPKTDRVKYAGLGGIVLCTGVLAWISGGFAFLTVFGPDGDAHDISSLTTLKDMLLYFVLMGFIWGLIIFNLDRYIVSSTGKGDGTDNITWKEFFQGFPRMLMAIVLSFAISTPMEIRILKKEIDAELSKFQQKYLVTLNQETDNLAKQKKTDLEKNKGEVVFKLEQYSKSLAQYDQKIDELVQTRVNEMQDKRAYGEGPVAKKLQQDVDNKRREKEDFIKNKSGDVARYNRELIEIENQMKAMEAEKLKQYERNRESAHGYSGLLKRVQISHETGGAVPRVIFLVFLCLELGPILFKMMMNKGVYDYLVENYNRRREIENGIWTEEFVYEGKDGMIHLEKVNFHESEAAKHEKLLKLDSTKKFNEAIIDEWRTKTLKNIGDNPSAFYTENTVSTTENKS